MADTKARHTKYWHTNLRYVGILLLIWFGVSYGAGILFKETLDTIRIGGDPGRR